MSPAKIDPNEQQRMAANIRAWLDLLDFQAGIALAAIRYELGPDADPWPEFRRRWALGSEDHDQGNLRLLEKLARHVPNR